ncbi:MAG: hypothetical protein ONB06_08350 [candidate division KSB1 bacterium]|nr:hypothetical protein [candidate division KSB1 bacterium]
MGGVTLHVADFPSLPELPSCCPQFREGSGLGSAAILWGDYPLLGSVHLGARIGVSSFGGVLRALEQKPVLVDDTPTEAVIQHSLATQLRSMRWEGYVGVRASTVLDVYVGVGTDLLQHATGNIREELVRPERGTFENGQRTRNNRSATLTSAIRSMTSVIAGMRFWIPLDSSRRWSLVPELSFRYALNPLVRTQQWYVYSVLVGAGIAFESVPLPSVPASLPPPVAVSPPLPLGASIVAYGVSGSREQLPLRVEEHRRTRIIPLLPVVYIDGLAPAPRYVMPSSMDEHTWKATLSSPLGAYYAILPIIAERLRQHSDTLTIVGVDGQSASRARQRAEYLARYLHAIWKIPSHQLRIAVRLDEHDTTARIVFEASQRLLVPIEHWDTVRRIVPPLLRLRPATNGAEPLERWTIRLWQDSTDLVFRSGRGGLPLRIDVELALQSDRLRTDLPLTVRLDVESTAGNRAWAEERIPIEYVPIASAGQHDQVAIAEYFFFPTDRLPSQAARALAAEYRARLRDLAIVRYGSSLELDDAAAQLQQQLVSAGFPPPRIERRESLYRPITPERALYGKMLAVEIHYVEN